MWQRVGLGRSAPLGRAALGPERLRVVRVVLFMCRPAPPAPARVMAAGHCLWLLAVALGRIKLAVLKLKVELVLTRRCRSPVGRAKAMSLW